MEFAWWLAVSLGLRRGEICGLSWADLDETARTLAITHSYDRARNKRSTKTQAGRRKLPLTEEALADFRIHRSAQAGRGTVIAPASPVIVTEAGQGSRPT